MAGGSLPWTDGGRVEVYSMDRAASGVWWAWGRAVFQVTSSTCGQLLLYRLLFMDGVQRGLPHPRHGVWQASAVGM